MKIEFDFVVLKNGLRILNIISKQSSSKKKTKKTGYQLKIEFDFDVKKFGLMTEWSSANFCSKA